VSGYVIDVVDHKEIPSSESDTTLAIDKSYKGTDRFTIIRPRYCSLRIRNDVLFGRKSHLLQNPIQKFEIISSPGNHSCNAKSLHTSGNVPTVTATGLEGFECDCDWWVGRLRLG
jgi:hypothetical protein